MRWALAFGLLVGCSSPSTLPEAQTVEFRRVVVLPGRPVVLQQEVLVANEQHVDGPLRVEVRPQDGALELKVEGAELLRPHERRRASVRVTLTAPGPRRWLVTVNGALIVVHATGEAPGRCDARLRWAGEVFDSAVEAVNEGASDCFFGEPTVRGDEGSLALTPALSRPLKPGASLTVRARRQPQDGPAATLVLPILNDGSQLRLPVSAHCLSHAEVDFGRGVHTCARPPRPWAMTNVCDVALDVSVAAPTSTAFAVSGPVGVPMKLLPGQSAQFMLSVDALALGARSGELVMQVAAGDVRWASTASLIAQNDPRLDSTNIYNLPRAIRENWLIAVAGGPSIQPALAHLEATLARAPVWPLTDVAFAVVSAAPDGGDFLSTDAGTRIVTTSSATWRNDLAALVQLPTASTRSSCIDALLRAVDFGRMTGLNPSTPWSDDGLLRSGARTRVVCITAQRDDTELDADAAFLALQMGLLRTSYNLYTYGPGGSCPQQEFAPGIVEDLVQRTRGAVLRTCESLGHLALPDAFRILTLQISPEDASWLIVDIDGRATPSVGANGAQVWQYDPQRKVVAFEEFHAGKTITIRVLQPCP